jgi:integrase/recombinase XerD
MSRNRPLGAALAAAPDDADAVTLLVTAWLSGKRSENTRAAYARDIGITPQRRPGRAPPWLGWCQQRGVHPVTGVTGLHVAQYARQLGDAGLSSASVARKLAAISSWYGWLTRRGHITASPAAGIARPRPSPDTTPAPALTTDQALALMHAADTTPGSQRTRTAALIAILLLTGARLSEVISADVADLGTSNGCRVLWVTRGSGSGRRQGLPLPSPAVSRLDAYLTNRVGLGSTQALFATRTGRRLFAADVNRTLRRLAAQMATLTADQGRHLGPLMIRRSYAALARQTGPPLGSPYSSTEHDAPPATQQASQDPGPGPWPRGRPHCRAQHPRHATRRPRPRLSLPETGALRPGPITSSVPLPARHRTANPGTMAAQCPPTGPAGRAGTVRGGGQRLPPLTCLAAARDAPLPVPDLTPSQCKEGEVRNLQLCRRRQGRRKRKKKGLSWRGRLRPGGPIYALARPARSAAGGPRMTSLVSTGQRQVMKSYSSGSSREYHPSRSFTGICRAPL